MDEEQWWAAALSHLENQQRQPQQPPLRPPPSPQEQRAPAPDAAWLDAALVAARLAERQQQQQQQQEASPRVKRARVSLPPVSLSLELASATHFRVSSSRSPLDAALANVLQGVRGSFWDEEARAWSLPLSCYNTCVYRLTHLFNGVSLAELPAHIRGLFVPPVRSPYPPVESVSLERLPPRMLSAMHPFQRHSIQFAASRGGRLLIADEMGTGKTVQAIGIACYYREEWPLLVVCPASLLHSWQTHLQEWAQATCTVVRSARTADFEAAPCTVMSYSIASNLGPQLLRKRFRVIIVDESHQLKNYASKRCKVLSPVCRMAARLVMLSGTPALSAPRELFTQLQCIDSKLFSDFTQFAKRYCAPKRTRFGSGWDYSGASNGRELHALLEATVMVRRLKADVLPQLLPKEREQVWLDLDRAVLMGMRDTVLALKTTRDRQRQVRDTRSSEYKEASQLNYSLYMSLYRLTGMAKVPHSRRYLSELLASEPSTKVLVFAHHRAVLDSLCASLSRVETRHVRIDGETPSDSRSFLVREFQENAECRVAVLSIKAAGVGLTLTAATVVVFAELSFNPGELAQAEDRAHRVGQRKQVRIKYLVARNTIEERIWSRLDAKLQALGAALNGKEGNMDMQEADTDALEVSDEFLDAFLASNVVPAEEDQQQEESSSSSEELEQIEEKLRLARANKTASRQSKFAAFAPRRK